MPVDNLVGHHPKERKAELVPTFNSTKMEIPDYLHPYAKEIYSLLHDEAVKLGVLKDKDAPIFIAYCVEAGIVREQTELLKSGAYLKDDKGKLYANPALALFRLHSQSLLRLAIDLGFTPKANSAVVISKTDKVSKNDVIRDILNFNKKA